MTEGALADAFRRAGFGVNGSDQAQGSRDKGTAGGGKQGKDKRR